MTSNFELLLMYLEFAGNPCEAASSWWIVEAVTAHGSSMKETARGEGENGSF